MPADLTGKRVLDIGCNEGFFSNIAHTLGASKVIGFDYDEGALAFARERYPTPGIEFVQGAWSRLPDGPFDLVLWTSSMHYELDPYSVFSAIRERLAPGGLLILECGSVGSARSEMMPVQRHSDTRWYPTMAYLQRVLLRDYSIRQVAGPVLTEGDPVPRAVYHCAPLMTTVLIIRGDTARGKTTLAALIDAPKSISVDEWLVRLERGGWHHTPLQRFIRDEFDPNALGTILEGIDRADLTDAFASFLAEGIARSDRLVVVEGALSEAQVAALSKSLSGRAIVWDAGRA